MNKQTALYLCCSCCSFLTAEIFTYLEGCIVLILKYVISLGLNSVMRCWKNYLPSCFSYVIFDWVLVSPCVLLHWNFCWPDDLWFSVWMWIFPSWLSLLWISSQKLDVHSDLILQGRYLYFIFFFLWVFRLRIKLYEFFINSLWAILESTSFEAPPCLNSPIYLEPRKFFWKKLLKTWIVP